MTEDQKRLRDALWNVSFVPGTGAKRIVHSVGDEISPRMEACLWRIAYTFRKQLPEDIAAEAVRRKMDHRITVRRFILRVPRTPMLRFYGIRRRNDGNRD